MKKNGMMTAFYPEGKSGINRAARTCHDIAVWQPAGPLPLVLTLEEPNRSFLAMETTIHLDDDLLAQAVKLAREKGCDLSRLIEETLRDKFMELPRASTQTSFRLTTVAGSGVRPGVDLNNSAAMLTLMEQGD